MCKFQMMNDSDGDLFLYVIEIMASNKLGKVREALLLSKTKLAWAANVSTLTIGRIERGYPAVWIQKEKSCSPLATASPMQKRYFKSEGGQDPNANIPNIGAACDIEIRLAYRSVLPVIIHMAEPIF